MQKFETAALILDGSSAMWGEELLFEKLVHAAAWVLNRANVRAVVFDGSEELRAEILKVYPPERVLTSAEAAECEVDCTVALPAPALVSADALRTLLETAETLGAVRLAHEGRTIAVARKGALSPADAADFDRTDACVLDADEGCFVVENYAALSAAERYMRERVCRKLMRGGVRVVCADTVCVAADSVVEAGATILPGTIIRGHSVVRAGAVVGPNALLDGAEVGEGATINASQVYSSKIGAKTTVGPFAYVRPGCEIGEGCRIGDFVELKNSQIGNGTKVSHLTYVGDSTVGERVNFGCGTVTVNYDGLKKHRTTIGDDAFIGCNSNLVAPITLGAGAYTAAGATVTKDVPPDSLYIARPEPTIKEGWAKRVRELRAKKRG